MNNTQELRKIIADAPEGATHFDKIQYYRIRYNDSSLHVRYDVFNQGSGNWESVGDMYLTDTYKIRSLADIRTILEQAERIAKLEKYNLGLANESHAKSERIAELEHAIEEMCSVYHCLCDLSNPVYTLKELLNTNSKWALDPQISSDAEKLCLEQQAKGLSDYVSDAMDHYWILHLNENISYHNFLIGLNERASKLREQAKQLKGGAE